MKVKTLERMAVCIALCSQVLLAAQQTDQPNGVRVSKLKGAEVKSNDGEDLGKVEDLIVDPKTGQITFAIVGKGILGVSSKSRPVPWQAVKINSEKQVTVNMDKQKMDSAPTVGSDYSDLKNPDAVLVIYRFYEIQPAGAGETPGGTGQGSTQHSRTNSNNQYQRP
jgi:sporulation protein YlmC with PRC-barrel domain